MKSLQESEISHNTIELAMRAKLEALLAKGENPYPTNFSRSSDNQTITENFAHLEPEQEADAIVSVAGRLTSWRNSGMFMDLHDASGRIQVFSHERCTSPEALERLKFIDLGDFVGATGPVRRTKRGELTVDAQEIHILCKAVKPMPPSYYGVKDVETRYRKRYLDVMVNEDSRDRLRKRSRAISTIRDTMAEKGFMELETPMLHPVYGGATARPFLTHHNSLDCDLYLRIAPELYLKRALVSGLGDRIFELNRNFRNEGLSTRHNPEFTMLEAYWSYADYTDAMALVEALFSAVANDLHGSSTVKYGDATFEFGRPFKRLSMPSSVKELTGIDFLAIETDRVAVDAGKQLLGDLVEDDATWGEVLALVFEERVEPTLMAPTHVIDFPKAVSPFAKSTAHDPRLVERFETFCNGWEICNAFSELNNPIEQRFRLTEQVQQARTRGESERELDEDFLEAMEHGMPPAAGLGIGIDRLIMLMTDAKSIREVILFPTLRNKS